VFVWDGLASAVACTYPNPKSAPGGDGCSLSNGRWFGTESLPRPSKPASRNVTKKKRPRESERAQEREIDRDADFWGVRRRRGIVRNESRYR